MKRCFKCKVEKPLKEFYRSGKDRNGKDRPHTYCKPCFRRHQSEREAARRAADPAAYAAHIKVKNDNSYLRRRTSQFGLKPADYFRILDHQEMRCAVCRLPLVITRSGGTAKTLTAHIDHDHNTGRVRGILCGHCNRGMGQLQDSPLTLRRAAAYVEADATA